MRLWPFTERRESSYTDTLVGLIVAGANGSVVKATATAAVEACAGMMGRAFAMATVDGPEPIVAAFGPFTRHQLGRALIRAGEAVYSTRGLRFTPAADWDVHGNPDPASWTYRLHLAGPDGEHHTDGVAAADVLHFRWATDPARPWRGVSPIEAAALSGRLSANTVNALAGESGQAHGSVLPMPVDGEDPTVEPLKRDLKALAGGLALVESQATGSWPADNRQLPGGQDWTPRRIGANPPAPLVELAAHASREIMVACGVSPALFDPSAATSLREAWRQFLFGTVAPVGELVAAELSEKAGMDVMLEWKELRASDIQGRARAFASLVEAGMDPTAAARHSGVE